MALQKAVLAVVVRGMTQELERLMAQAKAEQQKEALEEMVFTHSVKLRMKCTQAVAALAAEAKVALAALVAAATVEQIILMDSPEPLTPVEAAVAEETVSLTVVKAVPASLSSEMRGRQHEAKTIYS